MTNSKSLSIASNSFIVQPQISAFNTQQTHHSLSPSSTVSQCRHPRLLLFLNVPHIVFHATIQFHSWAPVIAQLTYETQDVNAGCEMD